MTVLPSSGFSLHVDTEHAGAAARALSERTGEEVAFPISGVYALVDGAARNVIESAVAEISQQITLETINVDGRTTAEQASLFGLDPLDPANPPGFFAFDFALAESDDGLALVLVELQCAFGTYAFQMAFAQELSARLNRPWAERAAAADSARFVQIFYNTAPNAGVIVDVDIKSQQNRIDHHLLSALTGYDLVDLNTERGKRRVENETGGVIWRAMPDETFVSPKSAAPSAAWWASHPGWASIYNKRLLPHLSGRHTARADRLDRVDLRDVDLSQRVLKPIDGRGGNDVVLRPKLADLPKRDLSRWVLQEIIPYRLFDLDGVHVRAEIRALCHWGGGSARPEVLGTLLRTTQKDQMALSKNRESRFSGAGVALFEGERGHG